MLSRHALRYEGIIEARMASSRFPGKPMTLIHGMPMIGHCYCRVRLCDALDDTYVATCDQEIYSYIESIGGKAIMTADTHERASDRAAEAMVQIEEATGEKTDILVMVQGDEPMITPDMVELAISPFLDDESIVCVNLATRIAKINMFEKCIFKGARDQPKMHYDSLKDSILGQCKNKHKIYPILNSFH